MKLNILFSVMTLALLNGYAIGQTRNFPVGNKVNLEVTTRTGNNFNWEKNYKSQQLWFIHDHISKSHRNNYRSFIGCPNRRNS